MNTRFVDWMEAFKGDEWECLGRSVMEERKGEWSDENLDGLEGDDYFPIYNYAYPLEISSLEDDIVVRICDETNCTVMYNSAEDSLYLALCGCGMDMSQSIALAYMIAYSYGNEVYGRIPRHMLFDVYKTAPLSVGKEQFRDIQKALTKGFESLMESCKRELAELKHD